MIIKNPEQRVGVLIDVQNLYHSAKNLYRAKVNFKEVLKQATASRRLIRAIAYVIETKTGEERPFFEALTKAGVEVKSKPLQIFYGGQKKANWDVEIAIDAIRLSDLLDVLVLISGDGDFADLVVYLKNKGRQVEVIAFEKTTSLKLKEAADDFLDLGAQPRKYLIK